ncbi:dUTP diphosphatase [Helicobacter muridarum]|uniref:dUTP diphosphatase n=1 Tax=Helicobacter muridarum TaxID=216 RepID=A0A099TY56_9HELI|nr:dUTP diphosphatase [Helicobacter muridarum]TLE01573.1 dUTP diphosphatase [Helicobacter muridarum]STQ86182.1 deoxyuridine 5'-triphosphate nucleotidohydrolase [Helicobacter muridarum]
MFSNEITGLNEVIIKFCKIDKRAIIPKFASNGAAGFDFHALDSYVIKPNEQSLIHTGLSVELPFGYELQVRPRSGLALNHKITILNSPGTVDSDYRGELMIILMNFGEEFKINSGDRIAQGIIQRLPIVKIEEVSMLSKTKRDKGGFGSTGI